jgi:hypothetical protein
VTQARGDQQAGARAGPAGGGAAVLLGVAQWLVGRRDGEAS